MKPKPTEIDDDNACSHRTYKKICYYNSDIVVVEHCLCCKKDITKKVYLDKKQLVRK